jgi:hypothetical protein
MSTTRMTHAIAALSLLAALAVPATTSAQSGSEARRPYRGLFGGPADPLKRQSLVLTASLFGAYDDNVLAGIRNRDRSNDWRHRRSGFYAGAVSGLQYSAAHNGRRWNAAVTAGSHL